MENPVLPAGSEPGDPLAVAAFEEAADGPPPQPILTVVSGGGDTTDVRATLHAVPRPE
jgi:hypothetical protein